MKLRLSIDKIEIVLFLFLTLFSNLLGRVFNTPVFNGLYYLSLGLIFFDAIRHRPPNRILYLSLGLMVLFGLYILDPRTAFSRNVYTLKDTIAPLAGLSIGFLFARNRAMLLNALNPLYLLFVGYAVVQQIAFYTLNFANWLPWDDAYVTRLLDDGAASNLYQGGLLRFFGPMNSFMEGQVFVVVLGLALALFRDDLRRRRLFVVNMFLALTFLVLALERSAILMAVIVLAVWLLPIVARRLKYVAAALFLVPVCVVLIGIFAESYIREDPALSYAYDRLESAVTLDFSGDDALRERVESNWQQAAHIAKTEYFGIGPGRVTPSSRSAPDYIGPHNNYLLYHLAYGVLGLIGFVVLIVQALESFRIGRATVRYFGFGLIGAYCLMAWFNLPFASRNGTMFFVLLGLLLAVSADETGRGHDRRFTSRLPAETDELTAHSTSGRP